MNDDFGRYIIVNTETDAIVRRHFDDENEALILAAKLNSGWYANGRTGLFIVMTEENDFH